MTRNLYVGVDLDGVVGALASPDPTDDLPALLGAIQVLQQTDFPTRAAAVADEIARTRPHVVGLQEVFTLDVDLAALGLPVVIHQDFLALLQDALAARGLHYRVAGSVQNTTAAPLPGVSLVDHDVILVDPRVTLGAAAVERNFSTNIGPVAPGVNIVRGWVAIEATVERTTYTLVDTHLESGSAPGLDLLRAAQAQELAASLGTDHPVILLGDLNDRPESPMYRVLMGAGFSDVWGRLHPGPEGFTCCHLEDLSNPKSTLNQRIDYVLSRGTGTSRDPVKGRIERTGWRPGEKVPGPFHPVWPSDHAGLVASLLTPPAHGLARR